MDTTMRVELDHKAVRTFGALREWAVSTFALAGDAPENLEALTQIIWRQVGERAQDFRIFQLHVSEASSEVAQAIDIWRRYFGAPMFHDWGCSIEFAA